MIEVPLPPEARGYPIKAKLFTLDRQRLTPEETVDLRMRQLKAEGLGPESFGLNEHQLNHHLDPRHANELRTLINFDPYRRRRLAEFLPENAPRPPGIPEMGRPNGATRENEQPQFNKGPPGDAAKADSRAKRGASPESRFQLVPFDEIKLDETPAYLVKGLIPRIGLIVVWGPPKCGKSFFAFDLAMHVALGWEYHGRRVRQGAVVYCALEGAEGFRARVEAFRQRKMAENSSNAPFYLVASPLALVKDCTTLIAAIRATVGQAAPAAVVIDTLNRSIAGSESDDRDMALYIQAADAIRDAFRCAVVIVHHCGIDATRPRGHTSLTGAAEAQLAVKRDASDNIVVSVEYMKDGPASDEIVCRLEAVEVGKDSDSDPITSCIVVPVEGAATSAKKANAPKLTKGAKIALSALHEAIAESGQVPPASNHIPSGVKAVRLDQWRDYAYRHGISSSPEPRARQLAFQRAHETLVAAKQVAVWEPYVWPTQ
jgi:AAA domain